MVVLPPVDEPREYNENYVYYWNHVGLELNRLTHSLAGPQTGPTVSSRVLGILHLAIHDAYFAIKQGYNTYLTAGESLPDVSGANDAEMAVAGSAVTVLEAFYARRNIGAEFSIDTAEQLDRFLRQSVDFQSVDALSESYRFGVDVGRAMLAFLIGPGDTGADQGAYKPKEGRYYFDDEPTNPVRLVPVDPNNPKGPKKAVRIYHAPFYGMTAKRFAVQMTVDGTPNGEPTDHAIADPPVGFGTNDVPEYEDSVRDVIRMGGNPALNSTLRRPYQTAAAYYWAYDGANLIGTPPRLYNQILRKVAWNMKLQDCEDANADFVRLFALVNTAMTDAGILCWREKYCFEFWRPLSGVREEGPPLGDPFWLTLGAPDTNTNKVPFKPPFPAYPSGHATFGAAAFQTMRLYYKHRDNKNYELDGPDDIKFSFVSEELNGVSRDLRQEYDPDRPITDQPGDVRTKVCRSFGSLWEAMYENAVSRVWLGVHWRFDAFAAKDVLVSSNDANSLYQVEADGTTAYKRPVDIRYKTTGPRRGCSGEYPIGGVPLGIGIANDVFGGGLKPTPPCRQPTGRRKCECKMLPKQPAPF